MKPPDFVLTAIERLAACSPCAKSKRAAVVFDAKTGRQWGTGFNKPPTPMVCDGSDACRRDCGKICIHAEQMALEAAYCHVSRELGRRSDRDGHSPLEGLDIIHVKVVDGVVVAGGPPSCWQCSRAVLEADLAGFWLFESNGRHDTLERPQGDWHYYTAEEFHRATLLNCGLHVGDLPVATHVLWGGRALCDAEYLRGKPGNWPKGQTWFGLNAVRAVNGLTAEAANREFAKVTCRTCKLATPGIIKGLEIIGAGQ